VALVAEVLSLGGSLRVAGHPTPVKLPFLVVWRVPLLGSLVPARFTLYVGLAAVLALAAASDSWTWPRTMPKRVGAVLLGLGAVVPLVPAWPYAYVPTTVPAWFTSADGVRALPAGSVLETFPVARHRYGSPTSSPVDWQAFARFRYRTTGGYVITRGPDGRGTTLGGVTAWERASGVASTRCPGAVSADGLAQVRAEWRDLRVAAVAVDPSATGAGRVTELLARLTGRGPDEDRLGMRVWHLRSGDRAPSARGPAAGAPCT
jgi:hypothetical protein